MTSSAVAASLLLLTGHQAPLACAQASGTITGFNGCFTAADWYLLPGQLEYNSSIVSCAVKCFNDGFPFVGMKMVVGAGVPNLSECECGCNVGKLVQVADDLCTSPCTLSSTSPYDHFCPNENNYMSLFAIATPDPFCNVNQICDDLNNSTTRDECEQGAYVLNLTYAVVVSVLAALVVGGGAFCYAKRRTICRDRRGPSQSMKRQILQDQLIGEISAESLVQQVNQSWVIDFHNITMGKMIAAGSSGQVYAGVFDGKPVAVKELFSVLFDPDSLKDFKDEVGGWVSG
jgi:hypothetical protein